MFSSGEIMITAEDLNNSHEDVGGLKDQCADEIYDLLGGKVNTNLRTVYFDRNILCVYGWKKIPLTVLSQIEQRGFTFGRVLTCAVGDIMNAEVAFRYEFEWGE